MRRIFSGIQPSGNLTLGNYLGAIRNWGLLQREKSYECIFCVVDQHAITIPQDPAELRRAPREVAAGMIAGGVDPDDCILLNQSYVPEHALLAWVLHCFHRVGLLGRLPQCTKQAGTARPPPT